MRKRVRQAMAVLRTYRDPLLRFSDYLGLPGSKHAIVVRLRNGLQFLVRMGTSDFGALDDVFLRGVYDRALNRIAHGDVVVDIGAQCGSFAVAAASRGASVVCFEPLTENVDLLRKNAMLNGLEANVVLDPVAIAGEAGVMGLHVAESDTGGSTFFPSIHPDWARRGDVRQIQVRSITLRDVFARHRLQQCACIKMDCEGAEYEIIGRSRPDDLRRARMIIVEYHPNGDIEPIGTQLRELGFAVDVSPNPCILFADRMS